MIRLLTTTALSLLLAGTTALAATVDRDLNPDPDGAYTYTPPEDVTDGIYTIDVYDDDGNRYARVWNTEPTLGEGHRVDKYELYYPEGQVRKRVPLNADGQPHGDAQTWDEDGNLIEQSHYSDGELDGDVLEYWPSGQKRAERHFDMGLPTGSERRWSREGALVSQVDYNEYGEMVRNEKWKDGKQIWLEEPVEIEGYGKGWKTVETNGKFVDTEIKTDGYLLITLYRGDKMLDRRELVDGEYKGLFVSTTKIDQITTRVHFVDGEEDGLYTRVWRGSEIERGHYDHGKRVGKWKRIEGSVLVVHEFYDDDGKLDGEQRTTTMHGSLRKVENYDHGVLDGLYAEYRDDEVIVAGYYEDGEKEGGWRETSPYTTRFREGHYENGIRQGRWSLLDENGYRLEVTTYSDGVEDGPHYIFAEDGAIEEVQMWRDGDRDGYTTFYDETGAYAHNLWRNDWLEETGIPVETE
ncbi:hypothetical protein [uncultured Martelella sp.]|uniref:toxin-antitoxin system YwqK family antitoxin n=1 Tax=uncultured Martelella sp. TaxID=392331 RepID=UPI0029C6BEF5|nr:hypothetical protein [uncultured Martelella sp.]